MSSSSSIHRGAYLLYLNGLEVPCPSVNVSAGVGMIPEASFSLAPHPSLQRLGADDRVEVVVFYLDEILDPTSPSWRLLFDGEIVGWAYKNTPMGRMMNFTAVADIAIFKQLKYFFMTATDVVGHALTPEGSTAYATQPGAFYPFSLFKKGLLYGKASPKEATAPDIERPFEILFNAVRGMMDAQLATDATGTPPAVPLVNFFSRWARKRNFQNKFAAIPLLEDPAPEGKKPAVFPILASVQEDFALKTLSTGLAGAGDQGSMWDVLQQVFATMYFELAMLPTAPAYRVRLSDGVILGQDGLTDIPAGERLTSPMRLLNYFVKPQCLFGIPPACNVVFPSGLKTLDYSEDYSSQPTRLYINESLIAGTLNNDAFSSYALTFGYPEVVNAALRAKVGNAAGTDPEKRAKVSQQTLTSGKDVLVYPEEFYKGPVIDRSGVPPWFTLLMTKHAATKKNATKEEAGGTEATPSPDITKLFDSYVRYEYIRKRYEKRNGSAMLHWNPYIVPGFPCYIFDQLQAGMHLAAYVQSVSWSLSTSGLSTNITFSYARTAQEALQSQYDDSVKLGKIGAGPAEPLPAVREIFQDETQAEDFYNGLFYGRNDALVSGELKNASAPLHTLVGVPLDDAFVGTVEVSLGTDGKTVANNIPRDSNGVPDFNVPLMPRPAVEHAFQDHDAGLEFASRPICTLDEYVRFKKGDYLTNAPDRDDKGAPYYSRIYSLRQGPASTAPTSAMAGVGEGEDYNVALKHRAVPTTFPQTRVNWDAILEAYVAALRQGPPLT